MALKLFDVRGAPDLKAIELFEREADVLRALRHHGVPEVHDRVRATWEGAPASDLYALGATFLHLATGRAPREFMGDDGRIRVPAALPGDPRLAPFLARLLRPSPTERFASARGAPRAARADGARRGAGRRPA